MLRHVPFAMPKNTTSAFAPSPMSTFSLDMPPGLTSGFTCQMANQSLLMAQDADSRQVLIHG
jgi:hypothetical protein